VEVDPLGVPLPVLPVDPVEGNVSGPLVLVADGVTMEPVFELTKIGGFRPVTKPELTLADFVGPVRPMLLSKN
jgi:hypothetical protein